MGGQFSKQASTGGWLVSYVPECLLPSAAAGVAEPEPEPERKPEGGNNAPQHPSETAPAAFSFSSLVLRALWQKQQQEEQPPPAAADVKALEPQPEPQAQPEPQPEPQAQPEPQPEPQPKVVVDPAELLLRGLQGQTIVKAPGALGGGAPQPFAIEGCQGCDIYVLDATAQVMVDDCVDCRLVLGPCAGSVFLRDCTRCAVVVACQQFRTRGCAELDLWLYAATAPSIESSHCLHLGCYSYAYDDLAAQFAKAGLDPKGANRWWDVYDFTPEEHKDTPHFSFIPDPASAVTIKPLPAEVAAQIGYSDDPQRCVAPFTTTPSP